LWHGPLWECWDGWHSWVGIYSRKKRAKAAIAIGPDMSCARLADASLQGIEHGVRLWRRLDLTRL